MELDRREFIATVAAVQALGIPQARRTPDYQVVTKFKPSEQPGRGVWHAGPFSTDKRYRFYPKQMKFGTDPVAIDRLLIDVIDDKRKQVGAISVWERDMKYFSTKLEDWQATPNINRYIREPGHIQYRMPVRVGEVEVKTSARRVVRRKG